ncbi:RND multidrug efflux transporter, Acriflavin resistance protein [Klebsiella pneumoniae]|uniref:RND multidrug efflux transporter, Acriflavin resistance protein n=1 Tax=Klebsiella pneumoniae TaxID=573 RepID=A0A377XNT3_KLEPN|nr:RND multidrug efflux transporter, Acriflavin resistance protein [Klebsiella pneumoniae]
MLTFFIRRPRFAMVIALLLTFVGAVSLKLIPVEQYPAITPPVVNVSASWPGASASDVAEPSPPRWRPSSTASIICCIWSPPARMRGRTA